MRAVSVRRSRFAYQRFSSEANDCAATGFARTVRHGELLRQIAGESREGSIISLLMVSPKSREGLLGAAEATGRVRKAHSV